MSVNRYRPHLLILPEDDANRQLANGFLQNPSVNLRAVQVLPPSGGWAKVHTDFIESYVAQLRNHPHGHLALLIDFDSNVEERTRFFKKDFPRDVADRVYLLGTLEEPEPLRVLRRMSLEKIGEELSTSCYEGNDQPWRHDHLQHNLAELQRLIANVKPFLYR
ncbi:hypothetical protein [Pseudomonas sp. 32_A]|uniref:hypothetical protein n=1 Tax=Pseudomonas sp. 32_A TaxID=2813559 RepID=UPI001A9DD765|nr:hypothetical protein [Pseudomonas sp. 32_A]